MMWEHLGGNTIKAMDGERSYSVFKAASVWVAMRHCHQGRLAKVMPHSETLEAAKAKCEDDSEVCGFRYA